MANVLNKKGVARARKLINAGKVDKSSSWSISAADENKMLGDPQDWNEYAAWHLGKKSGVENEESKAAWVYPFGKNGKVYRSALTAIRQRAGQQGDTEIFDAAGKLVDLIDNEKGSVKIQHEMKLKAAATDPASEDYGYKWHVDIVQWGLSKDGLIYWAEDPIRAAVPLYEGARVFALMEGQHQAWPHPYGKSVRDITGWMENVTATGTGLEGDFVVVKSAKWLRDMLVDSFTRGKPDLVGLSNDVAARSSIKNVDGKEVYYLEEVINVTVDVVYEPAAGGKFIRMAAAGMARHKEDNDMKILMELLAALKISRPELKAAIEEIEAKGDKVTEEEVRTFLASKMIGADAAGIDEKIKAGIEAAVETLKAASTTTTQTKEPEPDPMKEVKLLACRMTLDSELKDSGLPEPVQEKVRTQYAGQVFEPEVLKAAIKTEKEVLDKLTASGAITGAGDIRLIEGQRDQVDALLDDFFNGKMHSFKAAYLKITGDEKFTGQVRAATRLTASIQSGTFDQALGDAITRRMLAEYKLAGLDDWRKIVDIVPVSDFRTQRRPRIGGYGDLPAVAQGGAYSALTSPTDEEATYAPSKKGGTEDITIEAIRNDDVGAIRRIPQKLSRSAARTLYKFVFDFLKDNANIYDSTALFTAGHANLGTAALDATTLAARRLAMIKQTEAGSGEQLGIPPRFLILPADLEQTGSDLVIPPSSGQYMPTSPDFLKRKIWDIITVLYWTDANNWYLCADPADIPTIEIAFLDGNESPELFVQDVPNVGSMFSNDKLTYKIRHIYGGAVMDYRGFQGSVVA